MCYNPDVNFPEEHPMPIQTLAMTEQREVDTPLGPINVRSTGSGPAVL